jgi:hypothetical protein
VLALAEGVGGSVDATALGGAAESVGLMLGVGG